MPGNPAPLSRKDLLENNLSENLPQTITINIFTCKIESEKRKQDE